MDTSIQLITGTAAFIAVSHTVIGVDHYVPFVALARARAWSYARMATVLVICGVGHVLSSVVLGFVGLAVGSAVGELEAIEATRGELASYLIIAFGLVYMIWGLRAAYRNKMHTHHHAHVDGAMHEHEHDHHGAHAHMHEAKGRSTTFWALFLVFVFGPCEPLIPLVMFPAAKSSWWGVVWVSVVFGVVTIATMLAMATLLFVGARRMRLAKLARFEHAAAGFAILAAGLLIVFAGF